MKIISIDPGYERVGVAIIEKKDRRETLIFSECIETSPKTPHPERLRFVGQRVAQLIEKHTPSILATESLFFKNNQKTAMKVSEARGIIIYEAQKADIKLYEYTPLQIKIAVTGYGKSDKKQVIEMVKRLIKIEKILKYDDEYDAIAVGLTFFATDFSKYRK